MNAEARLSQDGVEISLNDYVFIRIGRPYRTPLIRRWRVRQMYVYRIKRTGRLRLLPINTKTGCDRWPHQCFVDLQRANGTKTL